MAAEKYAREKFSGGRVSRSCGWWTENLAVSRGPFNGRDEAGRCSDDLHDPWGESECLQVKERPNCIWLGGKSSTRV
jgi:hypothetical protein